MSVMPVFRGRKGMLFLHMENEKKMKKRKKLPILMIFLKCIVKVMNT